MFLHSRQWLAFTLLGGTLLLSSLFAWTVTAAPCPETSVTLSGCSPFTTTAALLDTSCVDFRGNSGSMRMDLVAGHLSLSSYIGDNGGGVAIAQDDFTLSGPAGGPVGLLATLHLTGRASAQLLGGEVCGSAAIGGAIGADGVRDTASLSADCFHTPRSLDQSVAIALSHAAGETFRLRISVLADAGHGSADIGGELQFLGLPPGYALHSCKGYATSGPTPVRAVSWGRLKTIYH